MFCIHDLDQIGRVRRELINFDLTTAGCAKGERSLGGTERTGKRWSIGVLRGKVAENRAEASIGFRACRKEAVGTVNLLLSQLIEEAVGMKGRFNYSPDS